MQIEDSYPRNRGTADQVSESWGWYWIRHVAYDSFSAVVARRSIHGRAQMIAPLLMAATDPIKPSGSDARLILAAVAGIALIVVLITWLKLHAFLALMIGAI